MAADRDLLFGLLALQNGLIDQAQLVSAFQLWTLQKHRNLAEHLVERGDLEAGDRAAIDALVARHLKKHGGDAERSLASFTVGDSTRERIQALRDPELSATLTHTASQLARVPESENTVTYSVGASTGDGQRFRVLRPHARGGLGAVFVALDSELHREVALKEILDSVASDEISRQRFLLEAEITGGLEHPGIVPVYGLGTHGDGRPFYAMRFIRGDNLKEAIEQFHQDASRPTGRPQRALEFRKLLRRFLDVCYAIEYAHSRGVLHRDIKPGNIIIGKHGETLVVDWGLARAKGTTDPQGSSDERPLRPALTSGSADTLPGSALGTPAYMSPEQAHGDLENLGPPADVYSLGATLYCLLTGKPPFQGEVVDVLRNVERGQFNPPRKLNPSIDRAIEAVCLKAMALKPADRYPAARALAEDVERWIADEPVTAHRDSLATRITRWGRHHRTAAASIAVLLTSSLAALAVGSLLINGERARAEANFRQARAAVDQYFTTVSESKLLDVPGLQPLRKELLDAARNYYEQFLRERGDDPSVRAEAASASFRVGWVAQALGDMKQALEAYSNAADLYGQLARDHPGNLEHRRRLAIAHGAQGLALEGLDRPDDAVAQHRQALAIRQEISRDRPDDPIARIDVARTHRNIGDLLRSIGQPDAAIAELDHAFAITRPLLDRPLPQPSGPVDLTGRNDPSAIVREDLGSACLDRAQILREAGRKDEAKRSWELATSLFEGLVRERPRDLGLRARLADSYANGHSLAYDLGQFDEAERLIRRSLEIRQAMADENPTVLLYRRALTEGLLNLAYIQRLLHREPEALETCRKAALLAEQLLPSEPEGSYTKNLLAQSLTQSASLLEVAGKPEDALPMARRAVTILDPLVRQQPDKVFHVSALSNALRSLGRVEVAAGRPDQALRTFERSAEVDRSLADRYPSCRYNQACSLALMAPIAPPDRREALAGQARETLRQAIAAGYSNLANITADTDLQTIRSSPEFPKIIEPLLARDRTHKPR